MRIVEFLDEVSAADTLDDSLLALARAIHAEVDHVSRTSVLLHDPETTKLRMVGFVGEEVRFHGQTLPKRDDPTPVMVALRTGRPAAWAPEPGVPVHPVFEGLMERGVRSIVSLPLVSGGRTYGVVNIARTVAQGVRDVAVRVAPLAHAAGAQLRLYTRLDAARTDEEAASELADRLEAVVQLGQVLTTCADEEGVLRAIRDHIGETLSQSRAGVFLGDGSEGPVRVYGMDDGMGAMAWGAALDPTGTLIRDAFLRPEPWQLDHVDALEDPRTATMVRLGLRSLLVLPIQAGGDVLGRLLVASPRPTLDCTRDRTVAHHLAATIGAGLMAARSREKLEHSNTLAQRAAGQQATFLAVMAHELRTPLHAVVATSQLLALAEVPRELQGLVDTIHTSGEMLSLLVDGVLDFSKNQSESITLQPEPFDLRLLLSQVVSVARHRYPRPNDQLLFLVDYGLDSSLFEADPVRVRQVMLNLASNAAKFTDGEVIVRVRPSDTVDGVRIDVIDSGAGIPAEVIPGLFDPFSQADSGTARRHGGTGLGLAICKQIVDAMQGEVVVESTIGQGSTFTVHLPGRVLAEAVSTAIEPVPASLEAPAGHALRVLLVDDNPVNLAVGTAQLDRLGVSIRAVSGAREALAVYRSAPFDLVLMDLHMPEVDGLQGTRWLLSCDGPHAVVVALTADTAHEVLQACREAGMVDVLTKPSRLEQLQACMDRVSPQTADRSASYES